MFIFNEVIARVVQKLELARFYLVTKVTTPNTACIIVKVYIRQLAQSYKGRVDSAILQYNYFCNHKILGNNATCTGPIFSHKYK